MFFKAFITLALVAFASAISVTSPADNSVWSPTGTQTISWTSVATDPTSFTIQLVSPENTTSPETIASSIATSSNSWSYKSHNLVSGTGYRVNLVASNGGILAQSGYFSVSNGLTPVVQPERPGMKTAADARQSANAATAVGKVTAAGGILMAVGGVIAVIL